MTHPFGRHLQTHINHAFAIAELRAQHKVVIKLSTTAVLPEMCSSVHSVFGLNSVRRPSQVVYHDAKRGTLPRLLHGSCPKPKQAAPVRGVTTAAHAIDGSTATDYGARVLTAAVTAVDRSVPWIMSCAKRTVDLLTKELRIWVTLTSAANSIYLIQAFLSMGWYLLALSNVGADLHPAITKELLIFSVLLYFCFELHNQISGHEADRVDKPHRPIPSGLMTVRGAAYRLVACTSLWMMHAWSCGVVFEALCLQLIGVLHYYLGWHSHWFTKNLWNGIGISMKLITAAHIVMNAIPGGVSAYAEQLSAVIGTMVFFTIQVQDLRDAEGDTAHGRFSLLHAIGENKTRWANAVPLFICSVVWALLVPSFAPSLSNPALHTFIAAQFAYSLAVCAHILLCRGSSHDAKSFMMYVFIVVSWCFTPLLCAKYLCVV